jgi:hypothetical protein
MVCQQLAEDPLLQNGYHALGFSQVQNLLKLKKIYLMLKIEIFRFFKQMCHYSHKCFVEC